MRSEFGVRDGVLDLYEEGIAAVERVTHDFDESMWDTVVCGEWSATMVARHLVAVADWYHLWLDRAESGDASVPFVPGEFEVRNAAELAARDDLGAVSAVREFADRARAYGRRLPDAWDLPYGFPLGSITAGLHAGVAACEWHLHAWDLSGATASRHVPDRPADLFMASGRGVAASRAGISGAVMLRLLPLAAHVWPWHALLRQSGRPLNSAMARRLTSGRG